MPTASGKRDEIEIEIDEKTITRIPRFPVLTVFDVGQTEGDELPSDRFALPTGNDRHGVEQFRQRMAHLTREGWSIETERIDGGVNGYTDHKAHRVALNETLRTNRDVIVGPFGRSARSRPCRSFRSSPNAA